MAINRVIAARTMRKSILNGITIGLDLGQLGRFFLQTISMFSADPDLKLAAATEFHTVATNFKQEMRLEDCHNELVNCITVLSVFLSSAVAVPGNVIFEAHSLIGCIHETLHQYKLASQSFTKALWIVSAPEEGCIELLAVALHRLGRAYGSMGLYSEAKSLVEKALLKYDASNVARDHAVVAEARELVSAYEKRMLHASVDVTRTTSGGILRPWSSFSVRGHQRTSLSLIREERPF